MNPQEVESKFYPEENRRDTSKARPDFQVIHEMMTKMKHPDLAYIWLDYCKPKHVGGKLILPSLGKDFFTSVGKQFFT